MEKLKKTFLSGLTLFLPIFLLYIIFNEAINHIRELIIMPISELLPDETFLGIPFTHLFAMIIFILIVLLVGLFTITIKGKKLIDKFESSVPGFTLIKNFLNSDDEVTQAGIKVCLAFIDDVWHYAFIIEDHNNGMLTVFIPDAPNFTGGDVVFMKEEQIKRLNISTKEAGKRLMQLGFGSKDIFNELK